MVRGVELIVVIAVRAPRDHTIHRVVLCPLACVSPTPPSLAKVNIHSSQSSRQQHKETVVSREKTLQTLEQLLLPQTLPP
jgi:hypothetical protein